MGHCICWHRVQIVPQYSATYTQNKWMRMRNRSMHMLPPCNKSISTKTATYTDNKLLRLRSRSLTKKQNLTSDQYRYISGSPVQFEPPGHYP
jgi:hypothetical protein